MHETILSRSLRRIFGAASLGLLASLPAALPAAAQEAQRPPESPAPQTQAPEQSAAQPIQRVEVTGSSIPRIAAESSLPITTIRAADFAKQGLSTVQEVLNTIPMNQTSTVSSSSVGSGTGGRAVADLRGLGGDKTLVLLNGRRLANHPYFADTVDLNIIPVAPEFFNNVGHYSTWSASATFTGNPKFEFTAGVKNLFDETPPFPNQVTNFQLGYDPRYTDPLGITPYMRLTCKF